MEIDDKLKNRLAGTAVVTVLAVIFLPMLFDDPVEKKGQVVSELGIPRKPEVSPLLTTAIVPDKNAAVSPTKPKPAAPASSNTLTADELLDETETTTDNTAASGSESAALDQEDSAQSKKKNAHKKPIKDADEEKRLKKIALASQQEKKPVKAEKKTTSKLPVLDSADTEHTDAAKASDKKRWVVQVTSLSDQAKANAFRDKLRSQGFPATVESVWLKGKGRVYRLKVGPELDAQKAQAMKSKINQLNNVSSIAIAE